MRLSELATHISAKIVGDSSVEIVGVGPIEKAKEGDVTLLAKERYKRYLETTKASAIITSEKFSTGITDKNLLIVEDPYLAFADVIEMFVPQNYLPTGVSDKAFIDKEALIQSGTTVMYGAYIEKGAYIGKNTIIYPNVYVGYLARIGDNCIIYPNVVIRERCIIGNNVIIHAGAVIGSDGFGFIAQKDGYRKVLQIGGVIIEDNVEIGANCTIDRATVGDTVIRAGTKLDNMIQIGHNVEIGENTIIAGQSGIAGSTKIGSWVQIGGQAGVAGHLIIGDRVKVGGKSGVISDVVPNKEMAGYPAMERWEWLRMYGILKNMLAKRKEQTIHREERQQKKEFNKHNKNHLHNEKRMEQYKKMDGFSNKPFANINKDLNK
ncbi:MAG: UDP-3-O-(3-hydroxymyristoyl)glucosamine N-acyltransferase [Deltaproteobacteria bacterium]|nr:UDP-3-O-(3-hydroxymyristoyl)glucosamine N-acyltransferase [Deltaproteobacteria bacterium]